MPSTSALHTDFAAALRAGKSYPPRTFREWIETELVIPDGPHVGERFRIERQPAIGLWIDAVDDPQYTDMVFTAVTQFGKSLFGFVAPMLYHACELGQSIGFGVPFADMADNKWQQDIRPVITASPTMRRMLPTHGSGSRKGTVRDSITLANGAIMKIMSAGGDDAAKAGFTTPVVAVTEAAKFSQAGASSVEADPLRQIRARMRAYRRHKRRCYIEGTLTTEEELPWRLRSESTMSTVMSPCPHCKTFIAPDQEHLVGWRDAPSEMVAAKRAHWVCPECNRKITEKQRAKSLKDAVLLHAGQKINKRGKVTGNPPESSRLWYHATPWANLLLGPDDLAAEDWSVEQILEDSEERIDAEKEKAQFRWSKIYKRPTVEGEIEIDRTGVAARRIELPRSLLPSDTQLLAIAYDLGDRTGWYCALAARENGTLHVPDYGSFDVPSHLAEPTIAIEAAMTEQMEFLNAGYVQQNGQAIRSHAVWVDAGHESAAVWNFVRKAQGTQSLSQWIMPCRGRGTTQMEDRKKFVCPKNKGNLVRQIDPESNWYVEWVKRGRVFEVHWDADKLKFRAQHGLVLPVEAPGAITLFAGPSKVHSTFARHATNERLIWEHNPGKPPERKWHRFGANHLLDCLAEAYCALCRLGYQPPNLPKSETEAAAKEVTKRISDEAMRRQKQPQPKQASTPRQQKIASYFRSK